MSDAPPSTWLPSKSGGTQSPSTVWGYAVGMVTAQGRVFKDLAGMWRQAVRMERRHAVQMA